MLVRDVMTSGPVTVTAGTGVKDALGQLARHGITSMPVLDRAGRLQGIVSEVDLIGETVSRDPRAQERPIVMAPVHPPRLVDEVCTRSVVTVRSEDDVATAGRADDGHRREEPSRAGRERTPGRDAEPQ